MSAGGHRVVAAAVQVQVGSRVHLAFKGGLLPDGVDDATLEALTAKGLIEPVADEAKPAPAGKSKASKPAADGADDKASKPAAGGADDKASKPAADATASA